MSALDKAFIKAYARDPRPPAAVTNDPAAGIAPHGHVDRCQMIPVAPAEGPHGSGLDHRVDDAHAAVQGPRLAPHTAFPASSSYREPADVSSCDGPDRHARPAADVAADLAATATGRSLPQAVRAAAGSAIATVFPPPCNSPVETPQTQPVPNDRTTIIESSPAADSPMAGSPPPVASAAPVESQRASLLRTVFSAADAGIEAETDPAFSPDWELDRLAWPSICERLIGAEERYFRSVGQRLKAATEDSHHIVLITGARRGEGRTTLALCLARCAARAGVPTALVDADLKNPQVGSRLGLETPCDWLQVVAGKAPLSEAAVASLEDRLTLFPLTGAGGVEVPPGDSPWVAVLKTIAAHYPLVIVDTGPLGSDGRHLFATDEDCPIDTAIVVRDLRHTTEKRAVAAAESLLRDGVPAVGIAENFRAADASA